MPLIYQAHPDVPRMAGGGVSCLEYARQCL
jgi:hypothetical protein